MSPLKNTYIPFENVQFRIWHHFRAWRFRYEYYSMSGRRVFDVGPLTIYFGGAKWPSRFGSR